jgi:hypothetical protein
MIAGGEADFSSDNNSITRRKFVGTTALRGAALLSGGLTSVISQSASAVHDFEFA